MFLFWLLDFMFVSIDLKHGDQVKPYSLLNSDPVPVIDVSRYIIDVSRYTCVQTT